MCHRISAPSTLTACMNSLHTSPTGKTSMREKIDLNGRTYLVKWVNASAIGPDYLPKFLSTSYEVTQVSGYLYSDRGVVLAAYEDGRYAIPGGHPREGESPLDTLRREVLEEVCVLISSRPAPVLLGGVLWLAEGKPQAWQLRYSAKVANMHPFERKFETVGRVVAPKAEVLRMLGHQGKIASHALSLSNMQLGSPGPVPWS